MSSLVFLASKATAEALYVDFDLVHRDSQYRSDPLLRSGRTLRR